MRTESATAVPPAATDPTADTPPAPPVVAAPPKVAAPPSSSSEPASWSGFLGASAGESRLRHDAQRPLPLQRIARHSPQAVAPQQGAATGASASSPQMVHLPCAAASAAAASTAAALALAPPEAMGTEMRALFSWRLMTVSSRRVTRPPLQSLRGGVVVVTVARANVAVRRGMERLQLTQLPNPTSEAARTACAESV